MLLVTVSSRHYEISEKFSFNLYFLLGCAIERG